MNKKVYTVNLKRHVNTNTYEIKTIVGPSPVVKIMNKEFRTGQYLSENEAILMGNVAKLVTK